MKKVLPVHAFLTFFLCSLMLLLTFDSLGQLPGVSDTANKNQQEAAPAWPQDSLGRRNPRGTVEGFIKAVADQNYLRAARYLQIGRKTKKDEDKIKLAMSLQQMLDRTGRIFPNSMISDDPEGLTNDNLGPGLEKVGVATVNNEEFDLMLESTEGPDGGPIWLFSSETVQRVPLLVEEAPAVPIIDEVSPDALIEKKWGGVPVLHWLAMLLLAILAYLVAWALSKLVLLVVPKVWKKARVEPTSGIIKAFASPIRLYVAVWLFVFASEQAGISIVVRQRFGDLIVIVGLVALVLLIWQLLDFTTRFVERRMAARGNQAGVSAILFLRRAAKVALVIVASILILDTAGVDVTTGLAALGIGGIALALGAQKTMENFVGSVTLIADQPVRVGDFCRIGDTLGTVEQIGMRSSRVRTLDRTVVTIPNGELSSQKIENFAHRDRFWFHPFFSLRYDTTPDQIRYLLVELRAVMLAHEKVDPNPARVRLIEISRDSFKLEIFAYVYAADFDRFLEIQEELFLKMMDVISESGTGLALPSQRVYVDGEKE